MACVLEYYSRWMHFWWLTSIRRPTPKLWPTSVAGSALLCCGLRLCVCGDRVALWHLALLLLLGPLHRLLWQRLALALSRSLFPLFLFFVFVLFVGLCVVSVLCAHLFVSLNYVLFIMACWLVTIKIKINHRYVEKKTKKKQKKLVVNLLDYGKWHELGNGLLFASCRASCCLRCSLSTADGATTLQRQ